MWPIKLTGTALAAPLAGRSRYPIGLFTSAYLFALELRQELDAGTKEDKSIQSWTGETGRMGTTPRGLVREFVRNRTNPWSVPRPAARRKPSD